MGSSCGKIPIVLVEIYLQKTLFFLTCMNEEVEEKLKTSIYSYRLGEPRTCTMNSSSSLFFFNNVINSIPPVFGGGAADSCPSRIAVRLIQRSSLLLKPNSLRWCCLKYFSLFFFFARNSALPPKSCD